MSDWDETDEALPLNDDGGYEEQIADLEAELAALRSLNEEAMEMLRTLEINLDGRCPRCFERIYDGAGQPELPHLPDCKLNALLQRTSTPDDATVESPQEERVRIDSKEAP